MKKMKGLRFVVTGMIIALSIVGALVGVKLLQFGAMGEAAAQMVMPAEPVNAIGVREVLWQPRVRSVGTVKAKQGTMVSTEVEGVVREIRFEAGSMVQAGDVLAQLDADVEKTQLRVAEAAAELARSTFKRSKDLIGKRNISQADYDEAKINVRQTRAQVDNIQALIEKKTIRAPFAGKLGIRRISIGQFLQKGSPIVSLQAQDPVFVDFSVPQQRLGELSQGLDVAVSSDAYPQQSFKGTITAINPNIDPATRNVRIQATLANADGRLRSGMFVEVELILARTEKRLVIPETAVQHAPFGDSVFVVEEDKEGKGTGAEGKKPLVVRQQFVRLGGRQGDFVEVTQGVEVGEQVASTGVFKLRPGMRVVIDNTLAPDFKFAPTPDNT